MQSDLIAFERPTVSVAWADAEVERLMRLRLALGWSWDDIAADLGRTESGVKSKFKYEQHSREVRAPSVPFVREPVPSEVLAEQARRLAAPFRSQASAFCGDPPYGFSALDQRVA